MSGYGTDFSRSVDVAIESLVDLPPPIEAPMYTVDPSSFGCHVGTYNDPFNVGATAALGSRPDGVASP